MNKNHRDCAKKLSFLAISIWFFVEKRARSPSFGSFLAQMNKNHFDGWHAKCIAGGGGPDLQTREKRRAISS